MRSERKNNLIKTLKRENAHLKWLNDTLRGPVKPLRIYTTDLKQRRGILQKNEIGYQLRTFLDEYELKVEDCGNTKRYSFDFWTE